MGADDESSSEVKTTLTTNNKEASNKIADGSPILIWLARDGPRWARIPAVIGCFLVALVPTLLLVGNVVSKLPLLSATKDVGKQLDMTASADVSGLGAKLHALLSSLSCPFPSATEEIRKQRDMTASASLGRRLVNREISEPLLRLSTSQG